MTHLGEEDIARLIDNEVSEAEREQMLDHMADCRECRSIYSETIKFLEEEGELKEVVELEKKGSGRLINMSRRTWIPLAASLLIVILAYPLLKQILSFNSLSEEVIAHHETRIEAIGSDSGHQFADPNNKVYAAIRIGIWMEDLEGLTKDRQQKENTDKYIDLLIQDLERFLPEGDLLLKEAAGLDKSNYRDVEVNIQLKMDGFGMKAFYHFGRFLESTLLTALDGKRPALEELSAYLTMAKESALPQGVTRFLEQLRNQVDPGQIVETIGNTIYIFTE